MNCVSCDICVYHLGLFVFFSGVFLSSRVTGACPVTTDLIMRVNVRTSLGSTVRNAIVRLAGRPGAQLCHTQQLPYVVSASCNSR